MYALILFLLALTALWAILLVRNEQAGIDSFVITPLIGFVSIYLVQVVYAGLALTDGDLLRVDPIPLTVIAFALVAFLVGFTWQRRNQAWLPEYLNSPFGIHRTETQNAHYRAASVLLIVLLLVGIAFYSGLPPILESWRAVLSGEFDEAIALSRSSRFQLTKSAWFGGGESFNQVARTFNRIGWAFLVVICVAFVRANPRASRWRKKWTRMLVGSSFLALVFVGGDFTRAPVIAGFIVVVVGWTLYRPIGFRSYALIGVMGLSLVLILTASSSKGAGLGLGELVERVSDRVSGSGAADIATIQYLDAGVLDHRYGEEHWNRGLSALPGVRVGVPFAFELAQLLGNNTTNTSYATTTYLGIVFLDFGNTGVVILYFAMGALTALSYRWLFNQRRTPRHIAAQAVATWIIANWVMTGPILMLPSVVILALIWLIYGVALGTGRRVMVGGRRRRAFVS